MGFDTKASLATIQALLKKLVVPSDVLTHRQAAENFQQIIAPLESNSDPSNPGLIEIFLQANADIAASNAEITADPIDPADIITMSQHLHDAYASYTATQYLVRVSNEMGFEGPAEQFFETVVPNAEQWGKVARIAGGQPPIIPPPAPPPPPTPTPPGVPPPTMPPPSPPPPHPVPPSVWLSAEQTGIAGSGEPNNGVSIRAVLGVNSVYIPIFARTSTGTSVDCTWLDDNNDPTVVGGMIDLWINAYNAANLAVILVLVLDCSDGTSRANFRPSDTILFLGALNARSLELAQTANRMGADAISIAPELFPFSGNGDTPQQYMPQWTTIVSTARSVFKGSVLYQALPVNAGPIGGGSSMDWSIWDAIGLNILPMWGTNTTSGSIKNYWESVIDTEGTAGYNTPLFGTTSWLRALYNDWKIKGKKIWIYTGFQQTIASTPTPSPPPLAALLVTAQFREVTNWPYASDSVWNIGIGSNATWGTSADIDVAQLRTLTGSISATDPVYVGQATDPIVTIQCTDTLYPVADQQVHIPRNATASDGMTFMDATEPNRRWSYAGCTFNNGSDVTGGITALRGGVFDALGDGITDLQGRLNNYDVAIGSMNDFDITQGVISHALSFALSQDSVLKPVAWNVGIAWPNPHSDFDYSGYQGHVQFGVTIGIPATVDVTTLGLSQSGLMLARALQRYGAIMRTTTGTNQLTFYTSPDTQSSIIAQMNVDLSKIIPKVVIMRNQSTSTVNGGGVSIAPPPLPIDPGIPAPPAPVPAPVPVPVPPAPPPAPLVTITGITLSNSQFIGGSPDSTLIGTIGVQTTGGAFTGSIGVQTRPTTQFQIVGNTIETVGVLAGGTYNATIVATMPDAIGSPYSKTFVITGTVASANSVTVNLNAITGTTSPYVWGVGTEGLDVPGTNDFAAAINTGWQATYKQQNWRVFRFNTEGTFGSWTTNSTARNNWFAGSAKFWDNVNNRLVFTLGSNNDPVTPAQATTLANYFKSKNQECFYWEFYNEPDGMTPSAYCTQFNAIQAALKAVNPNYKVGGPTTSYARGDFLSAMAASCHPDFISYHCYFTGSYSDNATLFAQTLNRARSDVALVRQYFSSTIPIFLGEYNIDYNGAEPMMQTIDGAVFVSLYTYASMTAPNANVQMGAIWEIEENQNFSIVDNDGTNIRPDGYLMGILGRKMGGNTVQVSVGSTLSQLKVLANTAGTNWAVWLTNYNTNTAYAINLQGLTGSSYQYWEISPSHTTPLTSTNASSTLANLTIPANSVVVLSNF